MADIFSDWMSWSCKPASFRLIIEEQDHGGPVGAADRHHGDRIGPLAGAELDLAARSLLLQGPLKIRGPFRRHEGLPRPADQARRRGVDQIGEGPVGPPDPAPSIHDADGGGDGVHHLLPGPAAVVVEIHQPGAFQGDAGLGDEPLQQCQVTPDRSGRLTADGRAPRLPWTWR